LNSQLPAAKFASEQHYPFQDTFQTIPFADGRFTGIQFSSEFLQDNPEPGYQPGV
jgi:hypothetical protein